MLGNSPDSMTRRITNFGWIFIDLYLGCDTAIVGPSGVGRNRLRGATARRNFGRLGCALNRPTWSPVKGSSARVSPNRLTYGCPTTIFLDHPTDTDIISAQHFWTGGLETAGPGCYDAVAIARAAGFRMLVMSRIRHAAIVP